MAIRFKPLPPEVFPEEARPYIGQLNRFLAEISGLEGVIRQPRTSSRSDSSITRGQAQQVHVTRITPDIMASVAGTSTVTGPPSWTYGLTNTKGVTSTVVAVDAGVRFPLTTNTVWGLTNRDVAAVPITQIASISGVSLNTVDDTKVLFNSNGTIGVDADFVWSGSGLGITGSLVVTGPVLAGATLTVNGAFGVTSLSTLQAVSTSGLFTAGASAGAARG